MRFLDAPMLGMVPRALYRLRSISRLLTFYLEIESHRRDCHLIL